ncbi:hypothetical protein BGZ65_002114 [Modicella reniformis]|uniref:Uncharacterized protein n=1 Tax=Modicella reniformis TaxID=1440133 RepID=A0A9P6J4A6_9FUNG|nr:hypothetical protein BGZ65_002114 [Modicella reniformis]
MDGGHENLLKLSQLVEFKIDPKSPVMTDSDKAILSENRSALIGACKFWNTVFIPQLYQTIVITSKYEQEDPAAFSRYSHLIRIIKTCSCMSLPDPEFFGPECRFLTEIHITGNIDHTDSAADDPH